MEVVLEVISDSMGEESFHEMHLIESEGTVIIELKNYGENRRVEVNAKQLRKALEAIKEGD